MSDQIEEPVQAPVEWRNDAAIANVNYAQRLIDVIAVPWNEEAVVRYRGDVWMESFDPHAFDGLEKRPGRVRANRDHDTTRTVGKVKRFFTDRDEGLIAEVRVSQTPLGDETLALAEDDAVSASLGFAARPSDQEFDKVNMRRRIRRAFADHLSFVADPAYTGASVLSVRSSDSEQIDAANLPRLETPALDEWLEFLRQRRNGTAS